MHFDQLVHIDLRHAEASSELLDHIEERLRCHALLLVKCTDVRPFCGDRLQPCITLSSARDLSRRRPARGYPYAEPSGARLLPQPLFSGSLPGRDERRRSAVACPNPCDDAPSCSSFINVTRSRTRAPAFTDARKRTLVQPIVDCSSSIRRNGAHFHLQRSDKREVT